MKRKSVLTIGSSTLLIGLLTACGGSKEPASTGYSPQQFTDALRAVMESDRTVYTKLVVNRLVKEDKVIKASEHTNI